ncbi:MAG: DUF4252 domain-containing protein [Weeksellaceae bacterium]
MKNYLILGLISVFILTSCANQRNVNNFYNKYQGTENTMSFKAPLFLASLMMQDSEDYRMFQDKIKSMRVLTINELSKEKQLNVQQDIQKALQLDGFENWFNLNKDGRIINISAQNRGNALKNIVMSMQGEDQVIFVNAKTNLTENELTKFITHMLDEKDDKKND